MSRDYENVRNSDADNSNRQSHASNNPHDVISIADGKNTLTAEDVRFSFSNKHDVLNGISLEAQPGTFLAILGVNGCGKSTLLECLDDMLTPQSGLIEAAGKRLSDYTRSERSRLISLVEQHSHANGVSVYEALLLGRKPYMKGMPTEDDHAIVDRIISEMGLADLSLRYLDELSGGEYQKVVIGRALVQETPILLLDEPTNNLDMANQVEVMELLQHTAHEHNIAVVAIMHDVNLALRYCDRFLLMKNGQVLAYGGTEIVTKDNIEATYDVEVEIIDHGDVRLVIPLRSNQ